MIVWILWARLKVLEKRPGLVKLGEITLPILKLLSEKKDAGRTISLLKQSSDALAFNELKQLFMNSSALSSSRKEIRLHVDKAKNSLSGLSDSVFKENLLSLADQVANSL